MSLAADPRAGARVGLPRSRGALRPVADAAPRPAADVVAAAARPVTWSMVDTGFHVASRAGEFVGSIDSTADGHFIAFDGTRSPIARYETLADAKRAVATWVPQSRRENDRELARRLQPIATSAAVIALMMAGAAVLSAMPG